MVAALSAAAAIPFVGWAATGAKFAVKGSKLLSKAGKVVDNVMGVAGKVMDKAGQVAKAVGDLAKKTGDAISGALGKVLTKAKGLASNFSLMDLANKLKGKLNDLMMKSPMLAKALDMANSFSMNLMTDIMSDAMFSAALDMLGRYGDNNIVMMASMVLMGAPGGGGKKKKGKSQKQIKKEVDALDKKIKKMEKEGADKEELKKIKRERSKLANQLDTPDDISSNYNLSNVEGYERKIDNTKYYHHDKGDFGEEVARKIAKDNNFGEDISDLFQVGRNGVDGTFLSKGPPPKITMIEAKTSEWANFTYSTNQKMGGDGYFDNMLKNGDSRYEGFQEKFDKLVRENPGLEFDFIRVEVDISKTNVGFGVDIVKVKDWNKAIK
ncbi:DUF4164 domain-containing protein [Paenibacillus sp. JJ-223]|uniref:DUF4164 domain-containing protein n=1 Tax=Paenibacillus sp. JJ-223 TaxID=2905647 RepID=UPI001F2E2481|nr:DUF4164 domain-containing protein [Paenibacillus sp. JJ-223]